MKLRLSTTIAFLPLAESAMATSFVVPTDAELVAKSPAIITGAVEGSYRFHHRRSVYFK